MARSFGSRRSSSPPPRNTATAQRPVQQQQPVRQAPPAPAQQGGMFSGLGGMVMQGMAFGTGSAIAHSAIRSITGGSGHEQQAPQEQQQVQQQQQQQICGDETMMFTNVTII